MIKGWEKLKFWKDTWPEVEDYLRMRTRAGAHILPDEVNIFKALERTSFDETKVVLLGQDPYHTRGMAHGLAFSVPANVKPLPPSLRQIMAEYVDDLGLPLPRNGDLTPWTEKGVLLLNSSLTVEEGKPLSHEGIGWEKLTYEIIRRLGSERHDIVFMLLGKKAQQYFGAIDLDRNFVIQAAHPSPLAQGFRGSKVFSRAVEMIGETKDFWRL